MFADGDLDSEATLRMIARVVDDPAVAKRMIQHQQIRQDVERVMSKQLPDKATAELRTRIESLAVSTLADQDAPPVIASIGR